MKKKIIYIMGASGSGTSSVGEMLENYSFTKLETDNYAFLPTNPPFNERRYPYEERVKLLKSDIEKATGNVVISGSLCGWGDPIIPYLDYVFFLSAPTELRLKRIKLREFEKYGKRVLKGGDMYENFLKLYTSAKNYDTAKMEQRSLYMHNNWLKLVKCPKCDLDGTRPLQDLADEILKIIK